MRKKTFSFVTDLVGYFVGGIAYAVAVTGFITPNRITPGGITGIAALLQYKTGLPSGVGLLLLNLPILYLGFRRFGAPLILRTAIATVTVSAALTASELWLPAVSVEPMLAAVFGGGLMGFGLSLVLLRGGTTGGVDILAKLLHERWPHLTVGRLILAMDAFVVILAAAAYRRLESALYSILALYVSSRLTDAVLYGSDHSKTVLIVTRHEEDICKAVHRQLKRTVTCVAAEGSYTHTAYTLLLCTVRRYEVAPLCRLVNAEDAHAFMTVIDAGEVFGEGFKPAPKEPAPLKGRIKKWKR